MARRTFADLDTELLLRLANRTDITSGMRQQFINDAYRKVCNSFDHRELQVATTKTLSAASNELTHGLTDLMWVDFAKDTTNGRDLEYVEVETVEQYTIRTGYPSKFYEWAGKFIFNATASVNTTIKLWYLKIPAELSGTSASILDPVFDPLILMWAQCIGFQTVRDMRESAIAEQQANNWLSSMRLPVRQMKKNDHRARAIVRLR